MFYRIALIQVLFCCFFFSIAFSQDKDELIGRLKKEYERLDNYRDNKKLLLKRTDDKNINQIKRNIILLRKALKSNMLKYDNPIYYDNDIELDSNINLVDFYVYDYDNTSYVVFGRVKNRTRKYLDWVKIRFNLYSNESFVGTDYAYIDFESYGYAGISPYKYSFFTTYINKTNFDSIAYQIEYDIENGNDDILWDQICELESIVIQPSGSYYKWQGVVRNITNYSIKFPCIYACILRNGRMVSFDYTYLDVQNDSLPPNSSGTFDSYIDLPNSYDDIKYYLGYALYSLKGEGNISPNIPIFSTQTYTSSTRSNMNFDIFIIDHDGDQCSLLTDFGDDSPMNWSGNYISGFDASVGHFYSKAGTFYIKTKAKDKEDSETSWSDVANVTISQSTSPKITTFELDSAYYNKQYTFQLEANGGIFPYTWQIVNGSLPDGLTLGSENGYIFGIPIHSGLFQFSIVLLDGGSPSLSDTSAFNIYVINHAPIITSEDTLSTYTNTQITYVAKATDPDSNSISFEFSDYPSWLSKTNTTLYGTTPDTACEKSFTLVATDGDLSDTLKVIIKINKQTLIPNKNGDKTPKVYFLSSNYPNPFNPITNIKIGVPKKSNISLSVFDINGRLIDNIYNGELDSGFYEFRWNAKTLPSGTYFIKMQTANYYRIRKCILLK